MTRRGRGDARSRAKSRAGLAMIPCLILALLFLVGVPPAGAQPAASRSAPVAASPPGAPAISTDAQLLEQLKVMDAKLGNLASRLQSMQVAQHKAQSDEPAAKDGFADVVGLDGAIAAFFAALITGVFVFAVFRVSSTAKSEAREVAGEVAGKIAKELEEDEKKKRIKEREEFDAQQKNMRLEHDTRLGDFDAQLKTMRSEHETQLGELCKKYDEEFRKVKDSAKKQFDQLFVQTYDATKMYERDRHKLEPALALPGSVAEGPDVSAELKDADAARGPSAIEQYSTLYQLAMTAQGQGNWDAAVASLYKAQQAAPDDVSRIVAIDAEALILASAGQSKIGIDSLEREINKQRPRLAQNSTIVPGVAMMMLHQGQILAKAKQDEKALKSLGEAITLTDGATDANQLETAGTAGLSRGIVLYELANYSDAAKSFRKVVDRLDGSSVPSLRNLVAESLLGEGNAQQQQGNIAEAKECYAKLVRDFGDEAATANQRLAVAKGLNGQARAFRDEHNDKEAKASLEAILRRFGASSEPGLRRQVLIARDQLTELDR